MKLVAKTLYGLESVLAAELAALGAGDVVTANRAVLFTGDREMLYRVNYRARTALSVLATIKESGIASVDDLYRLGAGIDWSRYLGPDNTFSVVPVVNSKYFPHTGYPALVLKDAIADHFRKRSGHRPSVDTRDPDVLINLHISNQRVSVSLDSSAVPLFKRGYRLEEAVAPLNEVLAAGILLLSGWNVSAALIDPMCGSGTFPIEAAMIACNMPPGKFRNSFGFQKWNDYDEGLFNKVRADENSRMIQSKVRIEGSDISEQAVKQARKCIEKAGLQDVISVRVADFADLETPDQPSFLFMNPPYGERIKPAEIDSLYSMIGSTLKHRFAGSTAWLITSNTDALKHIGLRPAGKYTLFNGALECQLLKYEMYQGSVKNRKHNI
jgi:putative N6-adenine-specific DNA methylase